MKVHLMAAAAAAAACERAIASTFDMLQAQIDTLLPTGGKACASARLPPPLALWAQATYHARLAVAREAEVLLALCTLAVRLREGITVGDGWALHSIIVGRNCGWTTWRQQG